MKKRMEQKTKITYYRQNNDIECIYYRNSTLTYPMHTHANHITLGYIAEGEICVICDGKEYVYHAGESSYSKMLKSVIMDTPENTFFIEDMARSIGVSPYHMIRKFKNVCGLTPHQFQIQCRVRKAQRLLEEGRSVTEVAYATGFCDQSHFDRCFRKIVRLTPSAYKLAVKKLA